MKKEARIFIEDILDSIKKIERYTSDIQEKEFYEDSKFQDAVVKRLEIIGKPLYLEIIGASEKIGKRRVSEVLMRNFMPVIPATPVTPVPVAS